MIERAKPKGRVTPAHVVAFVGATVISFLLGLICDPSLDVPCCISAFEDDFCHSLIRVPSIPLGIWFGMWGCLATYISSFLNLLRYWDPVMSFAWSWVGFIEALAPAAIFRVFKFYPDFSVRRGWAAKAFPPLIALGSIILLLGVVVQVLWGATLGEPFTTVYVYSVYVGLVLALIGVVLGLSVGHRKTWAAHIAGVVLASVLSGVWGAGTLTLWNLPPPLPAELFWPVFTGWVAGDLIVLSVLSTALLVALTPVFKRTGLYVEGWWA